MYGYIRPDIGELRINDYRRFRSAYCGLCEALRQRYGILSRFLVSYDMTFLALLSLMPETRIDFRRCPVHPLRKQPCICGAAELYDAADYTVLLAYRKMQDDAADERWPRAIFARAAAGILRRSCHRAAERQPDFSGNAEKCLKKLSALEKSGGASLDEAADGFAQMMAFPASRITDTTQRRLQSEILYHAGRAVYILDAVDDYASDRKKGRYNSLCQRFSSDAMTQEEKAEIRAVLNLSLSRAASAAALLPDSVWKPILENILSCGLPRTADLVFAGAWRKNRNTREDL